MSRIQETTGQQHSSQVETAELTQTITAHSGPGRSPRLPPWMFSAWRQHCTRGRLATAFAASATAALAILNPNLVQILERQTQTAFFELRGPVTPPDNIVIVAIDDTSLSQSGIYQQDPVKFAELEPIQSWPWKRQAYATVIERLLQAGAKSVAVDVVLSAPSSYGDDDDQTLRSLLARYPGQVVLAEQFVATEDLLQGSLYQRDLPLPIFQDTGVRTGHINLLLEPNGQVHRLGEQFPQALSQKNPMFELLLEGEELQSFAEATLRAAGADFQPPRGENIYFYGPDQSFAQIPFWQILDSQSWQSTGPAGESLQERFRDKMVLIGSTAPLQQDFHPAPFGHTGIYRTQLFGVEIQANAIASLQEGRAIADPLSHHWILRGLLLGGLVLAGSWAIRSSARPLNRLGLGLGAAALWGLGSFILFTFGYLIVPVMLPVLSLSAMGISAFTLGFLQEQKRKQELRQSIKPHLSVPAVREIVRTQPDLADLLQEREAEVMGKVLSNRYRIAKVLGTGGFSETYVANDTQRPGSPACVVKQLKLFQGKPSKIELVRRLFKQEAEALERLGQHPQIPLLLAYFEEDYEFYLVQELIEGLSLHSELMSKARLPLYAIVQLLYDMLTVLEFVHANNIIHRDIKPHNIIRRLGDGLFVLIDFGVAKKLSDRLQDDTRTQQLTIAIGTQGYIAREQIAGKPNFASDLYSLGVTAIEALTGLIPRQFQYDGEEEIIWTHRADAISEPLKAFLCRMVRPDYLDRYQSAREALEALKQVPEISLLEDRPQLLPGHSFDRLMQGFEDETEDASADTQIWQRDS